MARRSVDESAATTPMHSSPHYLLFAHTDARSEPPCWKVILKKANGSLVFEASDCEPDARGERLELLAVIRGLEALDEPSRVTLVTSSRYVRRGLLYGLKEWRHNDWAWEWYGQMVPVKNRDLWQRLDRALGYHSVESRRWRLDSAHFTMERPQSGPPTSPVGQAETPEPARPVASRSSARRMPETARPAQMTNTRRGASLQANVVAPSRLAHWVRRASEVVERQVSQFAERGASQFADRFAGPAPSAAPGRGGFCSAE